MELTESKHQFRAMRKLVLVFCLFTSLWSGPRMAAQERASRIVQVGGNFHFASLKPSTWRPGASVRILDEHRRGQDWSWEIGIGVGTRTLILADRWIGHTGLEGSRVVGPFDIRISLSYVELNLGTRKYLPAGRRGRFYYSVGILPTLCLSNASETHRKNLPEGAIPPSRPDYKHIEDPGELFDFVSTYLCTPLAVYLGWGFEFGDSMVEIRVIASRLFDCSIPAAVHLGQAYAGISFTFGARRLTGVTDW